MTELPDGGVPAIVVPDSRRQTDGVSETEEPIELLVQLAEEGEIDPWNIDIVRVTDKFLSRLDRSDLRMSARALFYASVLLRMKSDVIVQTGEEDESEALNDADGWMDEWAETELEGGDDPITPLEDELDRRLHRKRARGKPETLDELVHDLREVERETWWKASRTYDTTASPQGFRRGTQRLDYHASDDLRMENEPTEEDVTETAHRERMKETIQAVRDALGAQYGAGREEVLFVEIESVGGSRAETFLAVLFLAHRGVVQLLQDELFGDLWIQRKGFGSVID